MKIKVKTKSKDETYGRDRFFPDCPTTKALVGILRKACVNLKALEEFRKQGFDLEYSGSQNNTLDTCGAKRISEEKKEK